MRDHAYQRSQRVSLATVRVESREPLIQIVTVEQQRPLSTKALLCCGCGDKIVGRGSFSVLSALV